MENNIAPEFESGSGSFFVEFPRFAVTGLEFRGQNVTFAPTGSNLQVMSDIETLENYVELKCNFSGDLNGLSGLATENIKFVDIYTGSYDGFQPDIIQSTNLVKRTPVEVGRDDKSLTIDVSDTDIQGREDNLFYKIIPLDYLTFGESSDAVSGKMFVGFSQFVSINEQEVIIDRSNGNDLRFFGAEIVDIFSGSNIIITDNVPLDFSADFRIRTNTEEIYISGSGGASITSSSSLVTVADNKVTIPIGLSGAEFSINVLLDRNGQRESFLISEG